MYVYTYEPSVSIVTVSCMTGVRFLSVVEILPFTTTSGPDLRHTISPLEWGEVVGA
jgi:hypothetical protein